MLTPMVKWAQNDALIYLTVVLTDVTGPQVKITQDALSFVATGVGAQGENIYHLNIHFFDKISVEESSYDVLERNVTFRISKQNKDEEWPRLMKDNIKPVWLKIDFDKWKVCFFFTPKSLITQLSGQFVRIMC